MNYSAIGVLELSSIAIGYECEDAMLKAADVDLITARSICSGKYLIIVAGYVGAVNASVAAGKALATGELVDELVIPNVHPDVFPALTATAEPPQQQELALGILETFSATSIIEAADAAAKAAAIYLFRIHPAMTIGGKGYMLITGEIAAVQAAMEAGTEVAIAHGTFTAKSIMPRPRQELFRDFI